VRAAPPATTPAPPPAYGKPPRPAASNISVEARDPDAAVLLSALQTVYMDKLRPIEERWHFAQFHHDAMTVADLQAKPQVLLLGQYSTGKVTHSNQICLLLWNFSSYSGVELLSSISEGVGCCRRRY
jgi:N-terminal EH-domain containing protein